MTDDGPWNPGISSELPRAYLPLSTMFRPENVSTTIEEAEELSDFCGLPAHTLVAFRAERLIVHELLIRITADIAVPDGSRYADLGINFRDVAETVLDTYIAPHHTRFVELLETVRAEVLEKLETELESEIFGPSQAPAPPARRKSPLAWLGLDTGKREPAQPEITVDQHALTAITHWQQKLEGGGKPLDLACYRALINMVMAITGARGRLVGDRQFIARLAAVEACNSHGSFEIGQALEPCLQQAVTAEGYRRLPAQDKPVVLNVKGASAAGKSTLRPLQKSLTEKLGIPWDDFALVSPDIWRKFLLDYDALGQAYKYAGTLTGHEIEIIDRKLDAYMARKATDGRMTHLLIDRFRFDSFVPESDRGEDSKLLTRFGDLVYMFFVITPPDATVERAWQRGLKFGRYKAVDDLLDHNVEAFTGMPNLFFTWALRTRKRVHYEFVDNSVPEGTTPRTVAFGWNGEMNILDVKAMIDIDRFRKINVDAHQPGEVYDPVTMTPENNVAFLRECAKRIPVINFADFTTGQVYARMEDGQWAWRDEARFADAMANPETCAGLAAIGSEPHGTAKSVPVAALDIEDAQTLGQWGSGA